MIKFTTSWGASDWGITLEEYYNDKELRAAFDSVYAIMGHARRSMSERILNDLNARAACGGLNEVGAIKLAAIRNRISFQHDYNALKELES